ncbi:MAG TPA: thiamine phosphate synthase [Terriglobales bacterium]|nr:thiamine phosphate synthase [Terriglobales bacterium]
MSRTNFPPLYAILDAASFARARDPNTAMAKFARALVKGGMRLIQYRNKTGSTREMLQQARAIRKAVGRRARLIFNDRADLCLAARFDGVHVGQEDLPPVAARKIIGKRRWLGVSTHNRRQVREADRSSADYIAIGPVFATRSKAKPDPVVGLAGVRAARRATRKTLVAIGGITRANCRAVLGAGADAVAVLSDLLGSPRKSAEEFRKHLKKKELK